MTNLKSLVDAIALETDVPPGTVKKVSMALLQKFAGLIEEQENFVSPVVTFKSVTISPKTVDGQPREPQKLARMKIRVLKDTDASDIDADD